MFDARLGAEGHFTLPVRLGDGDANLPIEGRTQLPLRHVRATQETGRICTCTQKSLAAIDAEDTVWGFIYDLLQDPEKISAGMETLIVQERTTGPQDTAKEAKVWHQKIAECVHKRSAYQDQRAAGLMTLEELGSKLQELDDVRRLAQAELESLTRRQEHIEQLEKDREALIRSMAEIIPDALEDLTPQERNKVYRMLRLEVAPFEGGYEVSGAFRSSGLTSPQLSESTKLPELRFRALLTQGGAERLELARA